MVLEHARAWVTAVMDIAPLDIKGILQVRSLPHRLKGMLSH